MKLTGKVAIITGAGTGIGRACAGLFAQEGAAVVLAGRRENLVEEAAREIREAGGRAGATACDVTRASDVVALVRFAVEEFGGVQVVVNNAALWMAGTIEETSEEDWDRIMATNLKGVYLLCRHALPELRKSGGGAIVNIGSVLGLVGMRRRLAYSASKGGLLSFTQSLALDHAGEGIRGSIAFARRSSRLLWGRGLCNRPEGPGRNWRGASRKSPWGAREGRKTWRNSHFFWRRTTPVGLPEQRFHSMADSAPIEMATRRQHYAKIRKSFEAIGPLRLLGIKLAALKPGRAALIMDTRSDLVHDYGVHGGVLAVLADTALAAALYTELPLSAAMATVEMKINYLVPHREGRLRADARILRKGKQLAVGEVEIRNRKKELIAKSLLTFRIGRRSE